MKRFAFNERAVLAFCHDAVMLVLSWSITFLLFSQYQPSQNDSIVAGLSLVLAVAIPVQAIISTLFGMYQGLWRYASLPDVQRIVISVLAGSSATSLALWAGNWMYSLGFAHFFMQSLLLITLMAGSRISYRSWKEWRLYGNTNEQGTPVLVLGAGDAAVGLLKELSRSADWRVMGLLDDVHRRWIGRTAPAAGGRRRVRSGP